MRNLHWQRRIAANWLWRWGFSLVGTVYILWHWDPDGF